jgi:hypothetical protein
MFANDALHSRRHVVLGCTNEFHVTSQRAARVVQFGANCDLRNPNPLKKFCSFIHGESSEEQRRRIKF